jgi:hypothetical protein
LWAFVLFELLTQLDFQTLLMYEFSNDAAVQHQFFSLSPLSAVVLQPLSVGPAVAICGSTSYQITEESFMQNRGSRSRPIPGPYHLMLATVFFLAITAGASGTTFKLAPIHMDNGYVVTGTVDTDGTIGFLTPANFVKWNIVVTQTTDLVFTEKNTSAANISMVTTDGKKIFVPSSIDGASDGGNLSFTGGANRGGIPFGALVADFTGWNAAGGSAGWQTPLTLNYLALNEPNNTLYTAAHADRKNPRLFHITEVTISTSPTIQRLFGTIVTDGTVGALSPANLKAWHIVGREEDIQKYNEQTTHVLNATQVYCDGSTLKVYNATGTFQVGVPVVSPRGRPIIVTIADFTDPSYPNGIASYLYGSYGLVSQKTPLTKDAAYTVATLK